MFVYRVCSYEEIEFIFKNYDFSEVGNYFKESGLNTHFYDANERYIHFFHDKEGIMNRTLKNQYLCVYNIPDEILKDCDGIGYYSDDCFETYIEVKEYAVKSSQIKFDYLIKVDRINAYIDLDDYIEDSELTKFLEPVYRKENGKKLILKK